MEIHSSTGWFPLSNNQGKLSFLVILISTPPIWSPFSVMWSLPLWRYFLTSNQREHRWGKRSGLPLEIIKTVSEFLGRWWVGFWGSLPYPIFQGLCCAGGDHEDEVTFPDKLSMHACNAHLGWLHVQGVEGHPWGTGEHPSGPFSG